MTPLERIAAERARQVSQEGWNAAHDDEHEQGEMGVAAACYASPVPIRAKFVVPCGCRSAGECSHDTFGGKSEWRDAWPWDAKWDKRDKHDRMRQLEIAGALIVAEMERLERMVNHGE